ncbi:Enoyl-CoA hydratase/carnithine racemase [Brevibacterium iodinum ATCC 49514]|uniref:Enoyl-CoA hydratase/carnithine racemase n=1 Tax=Brevibacterium iodinum ATCC 49514 TaxID=1255616 RepID=A0A2H1JQA5_9MICO|nr:enoyl-CoA hydratase-related protein [Brevibacterium iodinum]SMX89488.1 Enoyl-CoA hydratase/carnithine racemase [Brevibacterium iodinum ATCC 49514]SUW13867.1 Probable enoyl-CoA hydratase echA8 [Brevibacterium iodinum]
MSETTNSTVVYAITDGVAHVEIDRADKLNSLTREVFEDLVQAGLALKDSSEVKAVVLSGRGRAFSAGLDFTEMARIAEAGAATRSSAEEAAERDAGAGETEAGDSVATAVDIGERLGSARALAQKAVHVWSLVEVPVIAAVRGAALGGGLQIALGADMRVAGPDAKLSLMELNWGIIPDMCGTQLLPRLVGPAQAKKLIVTADTIGAEEALRIGLVEEVVEDPLARALELAGQIAGQSRSALVWAKRLVDLSYDSDFSIGLDAEQEALAALLGTDEQKQVVATRLAAMKARAKG